MHEFNPLTFVLVVEVVPLGVQLLTHVNPSLVPFLMMHLPAQTSIVWHALSAAHVSPEVMHVAVMQLEQPEENPICCTSESNSDPASPPPDDPHAERTTPIAHTLELASLTIIARILMIPAFPVERVNRRPSRQPRRTGANRIIACSSFAQARSGARTLPTAPRARISTARVARRKNLLETEET
jgi:hypothetical protein